LDDLLRAENASGLDAAIEWARLFRDPLVRWYRSQPGQAKTPVDEIPDVSGPVQSSPPQGFQMRFKDGILAHENHVWPTENQGHSWRNWYQTVRHWYESKKKGRVKRADSYWGFALHCKFLLERLMRADFESTIKVRPSTSKRTAVVEWWGVKKTVPDRVVLLLSAIGAAQQKGEEAVFDMYSTYRLSLGKAFPQLVSRLPTVKRSTNKAGGMNKADFEIRFMPLVKVMDE